MYFDHNRLAFRSVRSAPGVAPLVIAYCSCVLLELSLKQHLNLTITANNIGHDLPQLIQRLGLTHVRQRPTCSALQVQLADCLRRLCVQGKNGSPSRVPPNSYPHLRYLRHVTDWNSETSSDSDVKTLVALLNRIISFVQSSVGVTV
jgi:hypothetical protein